MRTADLFTLGAAPINKDAARVLNHGIDWIPALKPGPLLFDIPPNLGEIERPRYFQNRPEDMTGRTVGRLLVIGWFGYRKDAKGNSVGGTANQKWLCRCECGRYCIRKGSTIKKAKDPDDKCQECRHLEYLKRHDRWRQGLGERV